MSEAALFRVSLSCHLRAWRGREIHMEHGGRRRYVRADGSGVILKHYRIEKVAKSGGAVLKKKDILARSDREALDRAEESPDCPICDVRKDGEIIGTVP